MYTLCLVKDSYRCMQEGSCKLYCNVSCTVRCCIILLSWCVTTIHVQLRTCVCVHICMCSDLLCTDTQRYIRNTMESHKRRMMGHIWPKLLWHLFLMRVRLRRLQITTTSIRQWHSWVATVFLDRKYFTTRL